MPVNVMSILGPILVVGRMVWNKLCAPQLRLDLPFDRDEPRRHVLKIIPNGDRWQVVFGLRLRNNGWREARNWRVRLVPDADTTLYLDRQHNGPNVTETFVGPGRQYEVLAANSSDTVPPRMAGHIPGTHALNFRGKPDRVLVRCWATAEGMPIREDTLCLETRWTTMTARFRWQ